MYFLLVDSFSLSTYGLYPGVGVGVVTWSPAGVESITSSLLRDPPGEAAILGVEQVGVPLAESSYFVTFADNSCCVVLSASVHALSAKKIQKVTIKFALFQQVQLF